MASVKNLMNVTVRCFAEWRTANQLQKTIMQKLQRREWHEERASDMNQSKNRHQTDFEEHDKSVLNPEIKNESVCQRKENLIEKRKIKRNGAKEKAGIYLDVL